MKTCMKEVIGFLIDNASKIGWSIFTILMILIFIKVYHNKKNFDPIDFVQKNCTVIDTDAQDFSERPDLEGELVAVSGRIIGLDPVTDNGYFPGYNFMILERLRQEDSKKKIRADWHTVDYNVQTCGAACIGVYTFCPYDIICFHNAPFGIQMDIDSTHRLVFYGIPSPAQGIILGTIQNNLLVPYRIQPHRSWMANLFCSEPNNDYTFFHYSDGTFDDLIESLRKHHVKDLEKKDYSVVYLYFVLGVPYHIVLRKLWPADPDGSFRPFTWLFGLVMVSQLVFVIFKMIVDLL
jgi:hypothetical protein